MKNQNLTTIQERIEKLEEAVFGRRKIKSDERNKELVQHLKILISYSTRGHL